jgi:hypothetical protein
MPPKKTIRAQTQSRWSFWLTLLVTLSAILAPSNLFYSFDQFNWAVRGLRIDYLLPKLYLSDLLLLGIVACSFAAGSFKKITLGRFEKALIVICLLLLARQFFTDFPVAAVTQFLRLGLFGFTAYLVSKNWPSLRLTWVWLGLATSNLLEGFLSLWQFFTQRSLGSYQWLFGEPNLSQSYGLAHGLFGSWGERVLPYGTTAHPNILAAWLVSSWLLMIFWAEKIKLALPLKLILLGATGLMAFWGIFATQSVTALGLFLHGFCYVVISKFWQKIKFQPSNLTIKTGLVFLTFSILSGPWILQWSKAHLPITLAEQTSITRRVFLHTAAQTMLLKNPIWGVGVNQFTAHLESTTQLREPVRFDQPVHNIFWLWLTETGVLGLGLLVCAIWYGTRSQPRFLAVLTMVLWLLFASLIWDHYLLTQPTGLFILWFWWVSLNVGFKALEK